jgi:hypothetical protein
MLYYDAAMRIEKRQRANRFIDTNLSISGGKEAVAHLKGLRK